MGLFRLSAAFLLESLKKFEQNFLRDFAPSSFQVGKPRESEIWVQIVGHRVEGTPHGHLHVFSAGFHLEDLFRSTHRMLLKLLEPI